MPLLTWLARACAALGGALLALVALMTCVSLLGRNTVGVTLAGDFELTGVAAGAAIALFLPWCQVRRGNIIVDFFTQRARSGTQRALDRLGALLLALVMLLLAWRSTLGGINAFTSGSGTMMLGFPEWVVYACIAPALLLTGLIGLGQALGSSEPAP